MTPEIVLRESDILRSLRQLSEARGLKFQVHPPREVIPEFLGDFQPDAIAWGPEGGIIIEVKRRGDPVSKVQLSEIARRVYGQKGWEFRAIYLKSPIDDAASIAKPTRQQLQAAFKEIEALTNGGHHAAALVTAWAALESLARLASADGEVRRPTTFSPLQAIQTLAEEGYMENETAERLRNLAKLRNAIVHGDLSLNVSAGQVEGVLKVLREIASDIEAAT